MNFYKIGLGVFTAILSFSAVAEGGGDRTFALMMERNEKAMAAYAAKGAAGTRGTGLPLWYDAGHRQRGQRHPTDPFVQSGAVAHDL